MVECICDHAEARLFSITRGMDKGKKKYYTEYRTAKNADNEYGAMTGEGYKLPADTK